MYVVYDADFEALVPATEAFVTDARLSKEIDPFRNITTPCNRGDSLCSGNESLKF